MKSSADRQADRIPPPLKIMAREFNLRATSWTRRLSSRHSPHRVRSPFKCSFPFEFSNDRRIECLIISPSGKLSRFTMRCFFPLLLTISIVEWSDSGSGHSNGLFGPSVHPHLPSGLHSAVHNGLSKDELSFFGVQLSSTHSIHGPKDTNPFPLAVIRAKK